MELFDLFSNAKDNMNRRIQTRKSILKLTKNIMDNVDGEVLEVNTGNCFYDVLANP